MKWIKQTRPKAMMIMNKYNELNDKDFNDLLLSWKDNNNLVLKDEYLEIRKEVLESDYVKSIYDREDFIGNKKYKFDLYFGIALHEALSKRGFTERQGATTQVWIYLITNVFPDIVRYRIQSPSYSENHMDVQAIVNQRISRIYLSKVWWYINLCLQENSLGEPDYLTTINVLNRCTTDTILQLVDRVGKSGYYIKFTRTLAKVLYEEKFFSNEDRKESKAVYRRLHQLNLIKINEVDPCLVEGSFEGYCRELIIEGKKVYESTIK